MKMSVFYHSKTGNTRQMAEVIAQGMMTVDGVEAKAFSIDDAEEAWAKESKCIVVGTPIYMASLTAAMKNWLEGPCKKYAFTGKLGGAFATVDYLHGGGELGIHTILDHMMVMGMVTYSGGGAFGKPVIHLGPVAMSDRLAESTETFRAYGQRMAQKAKELFEAHA